MSKTPEEQFTEAVIDNIDSFIPTAYEGYTVDYTALRAFLEARLQSYAASTAQAQRERDAMVAHDRATEWDALQESDTTGMAKPRYLEACDIAALIRDPSLARG